MKTTGGFSSHLDTKMGFGFDHLEGISIREQREIITHKAKEMNKASRLKHKYDHKGGNYSSIC